jgi:hypothetical protein
MPRLTLDFEQVTAVAVYAIHVPPSTIKSDYEMTENGRCMT